MFCMACMSCMAVLLRLAQLLRDQYCGTSLAVYPPELRRPRMTSPCERLCLH